MKKVTNLNDLNRIKKKGLDYLYPHDNVRISVGMASCGLATGAQSLFDSLLKKLEDVSDNNMIVPVGCIGFCQREPIIDILKPGLPRLTFVNVDDDKLNTLSEDVQRGKINGELAAWRYDEDMLLVFNRHRKLHNGNLGRNIDKIPRYEDIPFFKKQLKIALRNCGYINPESIEEYVARGGYYTFLKVLTKMSSQDVLDEVRKSGLRGRGGAGFPTWKKWELCRKKENKTKYVICNADEGDPGAYMDRSILEGDPHSVIEGMLIGALTIGASEGYIYVRSEYPLAIERFAKALEQAEQFGFLGTDILGANFNFRISINQGAGAFVCGEETSLIASIEGRAPEPKLRPPFPVEEGIWKQPTNINNVETWANIPAIVARGGDWFARVGTDRSKGTKVFSLVGKIENTGLIEVPMGIKLKDIIDIGGGIPNGKLLKAIQTGGPSGGCIPRNLMELSVDYEKLADAGSIMGSGGLIVMDEDTCMVDVAKFFLEFLKDESCGKCVSCREGTQQMFEIVKRITDGHGKADDIGLLEQLGEVTKLASLCGLGQTAANPVLSTLKYFRDEYEAHVKDRCCPAHVCKNLISFTIDPEKCCGCTVCARNCPSHAIMGEAKKSHKIDQKKCIKCAICVSSCPPKYKAVKSVSPALK